MAWHGPIVGFGRPFRNENFGRDEVLARCLGSCPGTRSALPVRRQATSSRFNAPRPWMNSAW